MSELAAVASEISGVEIEVSVAGPADEVRDAPPLWGDTLHALPRDYRRAGHDGTRSAGGEPRSPSRGTGRAVAKRRSGLIPGLLVHGAVLLAVPRSAGHLVPRSGISSRAPCASLKLGDGWEDLSSESF